MKASTSERDCATDPQQERITELEAVIERDRTKVAEIFGGVQAALTRHEWLRLGRGSYEWDDDRWKDEFGRCFDAVQEALKPLAQLACDHSDCPVDVAAIAAARSKPPR